MARGKKLTPSPRHSVQTKTLRMDQRMQVVKRDGSREDVAFEKVQQRITNSATGLTVNATKVAQGVLTRIVDGITTAELDTITANLAFAWSTTHPDYGTLASRIAISNHQKNTPATFLECIERLENVKDRRGAPASLIHPDLLTTARAHAAEIEARINYERDFLFDYFGFKTLERSYLLRDTDRRVVERPQHLWMRVALGLWSANLPRAFETYELLSTKMYTHATPTLFNAGTKRPQLSSCFLLAMDDSIRGIYKTLSDCAAISQYGGGIGLHISNVRAKGTLIRGTGGQSNGIVPMLRVFNNTARYVDQCFAPDTLVYTEDGPTRIVDIKAGQRVLTSGGNEYTDERGKHYLPAGVPKTQAVTRCVEHTYSGILLRLTLDLAGTRTYVDVTPQHPVLAVENDASQPPHVALSIGLSHLDYIEIGNLRLGDWVAYPAISSEKAYAGFQFAELVAVHAENYEGALYDLEVEGTHDYFVHGLGIAHNGGGKRNGSFAIYLEPWHADVEDFLEMKKNTGSEEERARDLFYAMWIPDLFMERVDANADWTLFCPAEAPGLAEAVGDDFKTLYERYEREGLGRKTVKAQALWFHILDSQIETGTPYLCYKDAANKKSNQKNLGTIKSSNLCVAPETYVLTDRGQKQISELAGQEVNVWNGDKWSKTTVTKTGENQRLVTVHLSNGAQITCTPYHKFIISLGYTDKAEIKEATRVDAADLKEGMKLHKFALQVIPGDPANDIPFPYTHGFFCGDGTVHKNPSGYLGKGLALYGEKKDLIPHLQIRSSTFTEDAQGKINTMLPDELPDKYVVPMDASVKCRLEWLAGLLDADGGLTKNGANEALQIGSIHLEFLDRIRLMLQTLGVQSKVTLGNPERKAFLPDGKGGRKEYDCKPLYRLLISSSALHILKTLGLTCHRLKFTGALPQRNAEQFVSVVSVADDGRTDDTYCFNEPENHAGVFNGVLTGNCTEIIEYSDAEETAVCNLASLSLPAFVHGGAFDFKQLRDVTYQAIQNLNRVIDVNYYPVPETERSNMRHRPVGLGVQGLADVFAMLGLAWEDEAAAALNRRIFAHMYYTAVRASVDLAAVEGRYETFVGSPASLGVLQYDLWNIEPLQDEGLDWDTLTNDVRRIGLRNSLLIAPMPTASTSQILGNCECIEPYTTHIYTRRTLAGEFIVVNKHLVTALVARGLWSPEVKDAIIGNNGSVAGLPMIPEDLQRIFKTVWEIKQKTLIDMAADRGPYICQSQSLNLFMGDPDYRKLTSMHFYAWRKGLKTGIYYLRTRAVASAQKFTVEPVRAVGAEATAEVTGVAEAPAPENCLMCSS